MADDFAELPLGDQMALTALSSVTAADQQHTAGCKGLVVSGRGCRYRRRSQNAGPGISFAGTNLPVSFMSERLGGLLKYDCGAA
jgi:hypothetical protein